VPPIADERERVAHIGVKLAVSCRELLALPLRLRSTLERRGHPAVQRVRLHANQG
jgi:hypothetical protein